MMYFMGKEEKMCILPHYVPSPYISLYRYDARTQWADVVSPLHLQICGFVGEKTSFLIRYGHKVDNYTQWHNYRPHRGPRDQGVS
ncbi:hypothetical protein GDO86_009961 [Hymenochirus boettgeri]|uniref:Uncharacterized protein n=1 Tax=Hymenochirus boettgeri TaxID=247094 RepID=A0A8T2JNA4_9PIPI|nr:hypothetical protein GDO86_009961 [Hymenochirus boettgeri]